MYFPVHTQWIPLYLENNSSDYTNYQNRHLLWLCFSVHFRRIHSYLRYERWLQLVSVNIFYNPVLYTITFTTRVIKTWLYQPTPLCHHSAPLYIVGCDLKIIKYQLFINGNIFLAILWWTFNHLDCITVVLTTTLRKCNNYVNLKLFCKDNYMLI